MAGRMTLYLPKPVEDVLALVPSEGRNVYVQMAVLHYINTAEGKKILKMLEEGYKPTIKG